MKNEDTHSPENRIKVKVSPPSASPVADPSHLLENSVPPISPQQTHQPTGQSAGIIVLQWLTYSFWGWLILALIWLAGVVAANTVLDADVGSIVPYAIAATLVLLPIAFVTDLFYRRHEPQKKTGAATVIMVIHAVIFALFAIGALILTVFTVLSLFVGTGGDSKGQITAIITELFATLLYVAAFVRTLNPLKTKKLAAIYGFGMLVVAIVVLALGVFGPMVKAVSQRDDRRIEANLSSVESGVSNYVRDNNKLPDTLKDVEYRNPDARALVDEGLVRYEKVGAVQDSDSESPLNDLSARSMRTDYRYQLCVTYKDDKGSDNYYDDRYAANTGEYKSYLSAHSHPAGEVCYKLKTTDYNY